MEYRIIKRFLILFIIVTVNIFYAYSQEENLLSVGSEVESFKLVELISKDTIILDSILRNKNTGILIFWTDFCPNCKKAIIGCNKLVSPVDSLGGFIFTINYDRTDIYSIKSFIEDEELKLPVLIDLNGSVASKFKATEYNFSVFIVNKLKKILWNYSEHPEDAWKIILDNFKKLSKIEEEKKIEKKD